MSVAYCLNISSSGYHEHSVLVSHGGLFAGILDNVWLQLIFKYGCHTNSIFYWPHLCSTFSYLCQMSGLMFMSVLRASRLIVRKRLEADHLSIVYFRRPDHGDIGGIQRDHNMFYQAVMCGNQYRVIYVGWDAMRKIVARSGRSETSGDVPDTKCHCCKIWV